MERRSVPYDYKLGKTLSTLKGMGLLLASTKTAGESNVMTIGWGTVGVVWGMPIFQVLVRPSRYTYQFIEESGLFTVNVPSPEMEEWVALVGSRSGRDIDKFEDYDYTVSKGETIDAVTIDDCPMVYECEVVHYNDLIPANLTEEIERRSYRGSDYHRVYFGRILGTYAAESY